MRRVVAIVHSAVTNLGLAPSANLAVIQELSRTRDTFSYRVVAEFGRDYDREGRRSRILVSVGQDKTHGGAVVLIRDYDSRNESGFTEALREALVNALPRELSGHRVHVERRYDMPSFYVP